MSAILKKIRVALTFNKKQQQSFLEDLASLLDDGVSIKEAINAIESIAKGSTKELAMSINSQLAQGKDFAQGLVGWFPPATVEVIRAGESSGTLKESILAAAEAQKQQTNVTSSLVNSITYPCIVLILALVMLVVIKKTVLMNFASIKPLSQWPSHGVALYHLAEFFEYWWWSVIAILALLLIGIYKLLTTVTGELRGHLDQVPGFSLYRDRTAARLMQTLGLLISNGIIIKKALNIMSYEAQPYLAWHLIIMEYRLSSGTDNIADVLDTNLIREQDLLRLKVVAKGKGFAPALVSLGEQTAKRSQKFMMLAGRIAGALILILGASIAANIIFGIYSVGSTLAR